MKSTRPDRSPKILNREVTTQFIKRPWENQTLYHRLVSIFQMDSGSLLDNLNQCVGTQNMEELHDFAHKLMGNCAVIGAERVAALARSVCNDSGSGKVISENSIKEIEDEVSIFLNEVELYLDELSFPKKAQ